MLVFKGKLREHPRWEVENELYRFRKHVFSDRLGWDVESHRGLEQDSFDKPDTNQTQIEARRGVYGVEPIPVKLISRRLSTTPWRGHRSVCLLANPLSQGAAGSLWADRSGWVTWGESKPACMHQDVGDQLETPDSRWQHDVRFEQHRGSGCQSVLTQQCRWPAAQASDTGIAHAGGPHSSPEHLESCFVADGEEADISWSDQRYSTAKTGACRRTKGSRSRLPSQ